MISFKITDALLSMHTYIFNHRHISHWMLYFLHHCCNINLINIFTKLVKCFFLISVNKTLLFYLKFSSIILLDIYTSDSAPISLFLPSFNSIHCVFVKVHLFLHFMCFYTILFVTTCNIHVHPQQSICVFSKLFYISLSMSM